MIYKQKNNEFCKKSPNYLSSRAQNFKGELWDLFIIIRIGKDVFDKLFDSQTDVHNEPHFVHEVT